VRRTKNEPIVSRSWKYRYLLPLLQQGLPATVDFDWTEEAIAKIQDALAEAERDP
jgi:hypothetical protein